MFFLDVDLTNPKIIPPDSLREVTHTVLQKAAEDPVTFWHDLGAQAIQFGLKVLAALLIYMVGLWLIGRVKKLLARIFERKKTERTLASFISSFVSISMTILIIIISISTLGVDTTSLAALLAAGGMALGMALSGTVQNFAGGLILLVFKPFKAGDFIEAQGYSGTVMDVSIVATKILTTDNRVVILPNGALSNGTINNFSAQPLRRVDWEVSLAYGTDAEGCKEFILDMLRSDERILSSADTRPKTDSTSSVDTSQLPIADPFVALKSLNDNDITFVVRAWVKAPDYWDVFFFMQQRFYTELPQHGYNFDYPHCDVTLRTAP